MSREQPQIEHSETARRGAFRIGDFAKMTYRRPRPDVMTVDHTVVDEAHRGQGLARALYRAMIDFARARGRRVEPKCPFVAAMFEHHSGHADLLVSE